MVIIFEPRQCPPVVQNNNAPPTGTTTTRTGANSITTTVNNSLENDDEYFLHDNHNDSEDEEYSSGSRNNSSLVQSLRKLIFQQNEDERSFTLLRYRPSTINSTTSSRFVQVVVATAAAQPSNQNSFIPKPFFPAVGHYYEANNNQTTSWLSAWDDNFHNNQSLSSNRTAPHKNKQQSFHPMDVCHTKSKKKRMDTTTTMTLSELPQQHRDELGVDHSLPRKTKKRSKKKQTTLEMGVRSTNTSTEILQQHKDNENHAATSHIPPFQLTEESFAGIEQTEICNAAFDDESVSIFLQMMKQQQSGEHYQNHISWTILFLNPQITTPLISSQRYCRKKSKHKGESNISSSCYHWNCTCDSHIRALQAQVPLLGFMVVFLCPRSPPGISSATTSPSNTPPNSATNSTPSTVQQQPQLSCFLLPLGRCTNAQGEPELLPSDHRYDRMSTWPLIPFCCDVPIQRRWDIFRSILLQSPSPCVTYEAILPLMVYHYHFHQCLGQPLDLLLSPDQTIVDMKLAVWMIKPHATEEELQLDSIRKGFPHLTPAESSSCTTNPTVFDGVETNNNFSDVLKGMLRAKESLQFLWNLYPQIHKILQQKGLEDSFQHIEGPLQSILAAMELLGIGIFPHRLSKIERKVERRLGELHMQACECNDGNPISLSSPSQVAHLLYNVLGVTIQSSIASINKNPTSQHQSTSEGTLQEIKAIYSSSHSNPNQDKVARLVDILLEYRSSSKLLTAFLRPLQRLAQPADSSSSTNNSIDSSRKILHSIHPMWMQTCVRTGRLSCRKPNMQQIPREGGVSMHGLCLYSPRDAFCASTMDSVLFTCDYSQNEVRILAHMSNDRSLLEAFQHEHKASDIYKQMSSFITGKAVEEVSSQERASTKQVVLAILYGMGVNQVASKLHLDKISAQRTITAFYQRFCGVQQWMEQVKESARKNGYVTTVAGRRRYVDINSSDNDTRAQAERQAINTVIQGSAADLIKLAMLKVASRLMEWKKEGGTHDPPKLM
jgi:DNA polymerase I-like protein with 3'-5' exonuclease and polymerase domains